MLNAHFGLISLMLLSGAFRSCGKTGINTHKQATTTASKVKALNLKRAVDNLDFLSTSEKEILAERPYILQINKEFQVIKDENEVIKIIETQLKEELRDQLAEWMFDKVDEWVVTLRAAKEIAYTREGDVLCKIIEHSHKKHSNNTIKLSRENLEDLLIGNEVNDVKLSKINRIRLLYRFSDDYAAWFIARLIQSSGCIKTHIRELGIISQNRMLQKDKRLMAAFNSCN